VNTRAVASAYLLLQGVACLAWWVLLEVSVTFRGRFELLGDPRVLDSFRLTDLLLIFGASLIAAWLVMRRSRWALPAATFVLGSMVYATGLVIALTDDGLWAAPGPVAMLVGCLGTLVAVALIARDQSGRSRGSS